MLITLRKIGKTPLDFELKSDEITFKGYLEYHSGKLILLKANINGHVDAECNLCAQEFKLPVDEDIEFFISDGIFEGDGNIELDVVESLNSQVDLNELLASEIELVKSDYISCPECNTQD